MKIAKLMSHSIYVKRDDFDIVNFLFLDGDVHRRPTYGVCIPQLIRSATSSHVNAFNSRKKFLTVKPRKARLINSAKHFFPKIYQATMS